MYELSPTVVEDQGFLKMLENCLTDGNAMVVSNTVAAFQSISESKGYNMLPLNSFNVQKLLTAVNECNEWGQIYIIDALAQYTPTSSTEAEKYYFQQFWRSFKKILLVFLKESPQGFRIQMPR